MSIKGELLSTDLGNVFQMLSMNRKRGRLHVRERGNVLANRRLYFDEDKVCLDERTPPRPYEGLLIEMGVVSYEKLKLAREKALRYGHKSVDVLLKQGDISEEELEKAERRVHEEEILEVFLWRNILFDVEDGAIDPVGKHSFNIDHLIIEAARRQDEWRHLFEDTPLRPRVYARTALSAEGVELDDVQRFVLDSVDGSRGAREIGQSTGLNRYYVEMALRNLSNAGLLEVLVFQDLMQTGQRLADANDHATAIRLFRAAQEYERHSLDLHDRMAASYLAIGQLGKGTAHLRFAAEILNRSGSRGEAITRLVKVAEVLPTEFRALSRAVALMAEEPRALGDREMAVVATAEKLLNFHIDAHQDDAAWSLAENLLAVKKSDVLLETIAKLRLRTGHHAEATSAYLALADQKVEAGDLSGAIEILQSLGSMDPANRGEHEKRIAGIRQLAREIKNRGRRVRVTLVAALLCGVVALAWILFDSAAATAYEQLPPADLKTPSGARDAAAKLHRFASDWPLTRRGFSAKREAEAADVISERLALEQRSSAEAENAKMKSFIDAADQALAEARSLLATFRTLRAEQRLRDAIKSGEATKGAWTQLSEAQEVLGSVERRIANCRRIEAAVASEAQRGNRAERGTLLAELAREYRDIIDPASLRIPLRVVASTPYARIYCRAQNLEGLGALELEVPGTGSLDIEAAADGYLLEKRSVALPPPAYEIPMVLISAAAPRKLELQVDSHSIVAFGQQGVVVVERTGRTQFIRISDWNLSPPTSADLATVRLPAIAIADATVVLTDAGVVRLYRDQSRMPVWSKNPFRRADRTTALASAGPHGVLASSAPGEVTHLRADDGTVIFNVPVAAPAREFAVSDQHIGCLLENGEVWLLDRQDGKILARHKGPFLKLGATNTSILAFTTERGLFEVSVDAVALKREEKSGHCLLIHHDGSGTALVLNDRLVILPSGGAGTAEVILLPEDAKVARGQEDQRLVIRAHSGRVYVFDLPSRSFVGSSAPIADAVVGPVVLGNSMVFANDRRELLVLSLLR